MRAGWFDVRPEERTTTGRAFVVLLLITAGHTLSETARDALFLARIAPTRLPWVYLGLALVGAIVGMRPRAPASPRRLGVALLASATVTATFGFVLEGPAIALVYALYLWTGIFASVITVELWMLLGRLHTATQAKRLYSLIGAGSVLGAVVGSATSRLLAERLTPAPMLFGAALLIALSAPLALSLPEAPAERALAPARRAAIRASLESVWSAPYPKRVLLLTLLGAATLTLGDFAFKSVVAQTVPKERLVAYLSTVSLLLSSLSLLAQLGLSRWLLRRLGVRAALLMLPLGMLAGGIGVTLGGGLRAVLALKGADGALRYSVHRTGLELLMVPVHDVIRERVKPVIDLVGQRGGQCLASLLILGLLALAAGQLPIGLLITVLAALWLAVTFSVHAHYLDLFRTSLREGGISTHVEMPPLDLGALETLLVGLNSTDDNEVVGALDILAAQGKEHLIPALILYHPSKAVVLRALSLFVDLGRKDFVPIADRLLAHPSREVAAAALRARTVVAPDAKMLAQGLADCCAEVRAAAVVAMGARGFAEAERTRTLLHELARVGSAVRVEIARSIAYESAASPEALGPAISAVFDALLIALATDQDSSTRADVARAMARRASPAFFAPLVAMLDDHTHRPLTRAAIRAIPGALELIDRALRDASLPQDVRIHLPRTLSNLPADEALPILLFHLREERDGAVRYNVLRALIRLRRASPGIVIDEATLTTVLDDTLDRARAHARSRAALLAEPAAKPSPARQLLAELLFDKEVHALDRVCSLLELGNLEEDFAKIFRGLRSTSPRLRSSSRELLETVLHAPHRDRVLALVDDIAGDAAPESVVGSPGEVVRALAIDRDPLVSTIAAYLATDEGLELGPVVVEQVKRTAKETVLGEDFLEGPLTRRSGVLA
ncbi:MAG: HEAT repeat domain-containing protein [Minicystis sp.]